jgi:hypothetical protein
MFNKAKILHTLYINKFYNRKLAYLGALIGGFSGLSYCFDYYNKKIYNNIIINIDEHLNEFDFNKNEKKIIDLFNIKRYKVKNPFSYIIIDKAHYSVNIFTTMCTGIIIGYTSIIYFPFTITGVIIYNLITKQKED